MRPHDWPERFDTYLLECKDKPFKWAEHDCAQIVCGWISLCTGINPADKFDYKDKASALAVLKEYGGLEGLAESIAKEYGFEEIHSNFASTGDVVLAQDAELSHGHPVLGLMSADGRVLVPTKTGLGQVLRNKSIRAWRIQ